MATRRKLCIDGVVYGVTEAREKAKMLLSKKGSIKKNTPEWNFVLWIIQQRRPNLDTSKVLRIKVDNGEDGRNNCFWYKTKQIDWDSFSYKKAFEPDTQKISNKQTNEVLSKGDVLKAFRNQVYYQIKGFRESKLEKNYKLRLLAKQDPFNVHTDHIVPFHVLVSDFLKDKNMSIADVCIEKTTIFGKESFKLSDSNLGGDWEDYHKKYAKLQLLTKEQNLSKAGRYDIPLYRYKKEREETYD